MNLNGTWKNYILEKNLFPENTIPARIVAGVDNQVWLSVDHYIFQNFGNFSGSSSRTHGFLLLEPAKQTLLSLPEMGLPKVPYPLYQMMCDPLGRLWIFLLPDTICCFNGKTSQLFTQGSNGLPSDVSSIMSLNANPFAYDYKGRLWVAMGTENVYFFDGHIWQRFGPEQCPLIDGEVIKIATDYKGQIWFVIQKAKTTYFARFDGQQCEIVADLSIGYKLGVQAFVVDHSNRLFVGWQFESLGLWVYEPKEKNWKKYKAKNSALPYNFVDAIAVDKKGRVWVGNGVGVTIFDFDHDWSVCWQAMTPDGPLVAPDNINRLSPDDIEHRQARKQEIARIGDQGDDRYYLFIGGELSADANGRIWIKSHNGVCVYSEE